MASPTPTATATATPLSGTAFGATQDSWILQASPNQNKGKDGNLHAQGLSGKLRRTLVQFDLSSIPPSSCVSSAMLRLTLTKVPATSRIYNVHRVLASWTAGTGVTNSGVTWNWRDGVLPWDTAGGDFAAAPTAATPTGRIKGVTLQWNVTADVAAFVAGTAVNNGWLIRDANEGTGGEFAFASRENGAAAKRPQLVVSFSACP